MYISENKLINMFGATIYQRGLDYCRDELVEVHTNNETRIEATVYGTMPYTVIIQNIGDSLSYSCDCPFARPCKHIAATLIEAGNKFIEFGGQLALFESPAPPPAWQNYFQQMDEPERTGSQKSSIWRMIYYLDLQKNNWYFIARKQKLKKNGEWGKWQSPSQNDFSNDLVLSKEDKLVLSFLEKWRMANSLFYYYYSSYSEGHRYELEYGATVGVIFNNLRKALLTREPEGEPVTIPIHDSVGRIEFSLEKIENRFSFGPSLFVDNREVPLCGNFVLLTTEPAWILFEDKLVELSGNYQVSSLVPFMKSEYKLEISKDDVSNFINSLSTQPTLLEAFRLPDSKIKTVSGITEKRLYLKENCEGISIQVKFVYGDMEVGSNENRAAFWSLEEDNETYLKILRDPEAEAATIEQLCQTRVKRSGGGEIRTYKNRALQWLLEDVPKLLNDGFVVFGEENLKKFKINRATPQVRVQINSGIDWFDLNIEIDIGGILLSLQELQRAVRQKQQYVKLADGSRAALPKAWLNKFRHAINLGENEEKNRLRFSHFHVSLIDELFAETELNLDDNLFTEKLEQLNRFKEIKQQTLPKSLKAKLRPYQHQGFNWLHFLQEFRFGGCLADDMGLGKTVQALAILTADAENGVHQPSLVVTPTSVVFNWENEIARFTPNLRVLNQTGTDRKRMNVDYHAYDIVLTSYGTLRNDILFLKDVEFHYVVLDESQNIKNPLSQTAKAAKLLKARHKLALTGTPIENNTLELWSLFSFLNPGLLGGVTYFKEAFARPIEKNNDNETADLLRKIVFPFILRRTKDKVATELPPKVENILYVEMSPPQTQVYNRWRDYYRAALLKQIADVGLNKSRMNVLQGLTKLRQLACHPLLVEDKFSGSCTKYETLLEHIDEIRAEGHKILVFSQFVKMLTIIRKYFDSARTNYAYLDGKTRDRQTCVEEFEQNDDCRIFLISLKAGGTGLNLTSADYVIHYDPWWNPAVEMQATDRTHRIGQDKHVFVYKMITKNTVEEKILKLQDKKKDLVNKIVSTDAGLFKNLTVEDLRDLFS